MGRSAHNPLLRSRFPHNIANLAKFGYNLPMRTANIGTLKNQLSAYLKFVRDGEEVIICDRNVPVARILPFEPNAAPPPVKIGLTEEEAELASTRKMKPPTKKMDWEAFWSLPRSSVSDDAAREAIKWAKGDR